MEGVLTQLLWFLAASGTVGKPSSVPRRTLKGSFRLIGPMLVCMVGGGALHRCAWGEGGQRGAAAGPGGGESLHYGRGGSIMASTRGPPRRLSLVLMSCSSAGASRAAPTQLREDARGGGGGGLCNCGALEGSHAHV